MNIFLSFLLGGGIALVPSLVFAKIFFKYSKGKEPHKIVNALYIGEALKFILTIVLFILAFQWKEVEGLSLFVGFILSQAIYWFLLVRM